MAPFQAGSIVEHIVRQGRRTEYAPAVFVSEELDSCLLRFCHDGLETRCKLTDVRPEPPAAVLLLYDVKPETPVDMYNHLTGCWHSMVSMQQVSSGDCDIQLLEPGSLNAVPYTQPRLRMGVEHVSGDTAAPWQPRAVHAACRLIINKGIIKATIKQSRAAATVKPLFPYSGITKPSKAAGNAGAQGLPEAMYEPRWGVKRNSTGGISVRKSPYQAVAARAYDLWRGTPDNYSEQEWEQVQDYLQLSDAEVPCLLPDDPAAPGATGQGCTFNSSGWQGAEEEGVQFVAHAGAEVAEAAEEDGAPVAAGASKVAGNRQQGAGSGRPGKYNSSSSGGYKTSLAHAHQESMWQAFQPAAHAGRGGGRHHQHHPLAASAAAGMVGRQPPGGGRGSNEAGSSSNSSGGSRVQKVAEAPLPLNHNLFNPYAIKVLAEKAAEWPPGDMSLAAGLTSKTNQRLSAAPLLHRSSAQLLQPLHVAGRDVPHSTQSWQQLGSNPYAALGHPLDLQQATPQLRQCQQPQLQPNIGTWQRQAPRTPNHTPGSSAPGSPALGGGGGDAVDYCMDDAPRYRNPKHTSQSTSSPHRGRALHSASLHHAGSRSSSLGRSRSGGARSGSPSLRPAQAGISKVRTPSRMQDMHSIEDLMGSVSAATAGAGVRAASMTADQRQQLQEQEVPLLPDDHRQQHLEGLPVSHPQALPETLRMLSLEKTNPREDAAPPSPAAEEEDDGFLYEGVDCYANPTGLQAHGGEEGKQQQAEDAGLGLCAGCFEEDGAWQQEQVTTPLPGVHSGMPPGPLAYQSNLIQQMHQQQQQMQQQLQQQQQQQQHASAASAEGFGTNSYLRGIHTYQILEKLAQGGYGTTYRAKDLNTERYVAVKVIDLFGHSPDFIVRAKQEAVLLSRLEHRNVIGFIEAKLVGDFLCTVMQLAACDLYVWREELAGMWDGPTANHEVKVAEVGRRFLQVVQGVRYMEGQNVAHRDLKPENLLVTGTTLKLADFGCAKEVEAPWSTGQARTLLGTPQYWPPEMFDAEEDREREPHSTYPTHGLEPWGLGIVLHLLLVGKTPFLKASYSQDIKACNVNIPLNLVKHEVYWQPLELLGHLLCPLHERWTTAQVLDHPWMVEVAAELVANPPWEPPVPPRLQDPEGVEVVLGLQQR